MSAKRLQELEEAVVEAVSILDESDGSRIGSSESIDSARSVLQTAYGDSLNADVQDFIENSDDDDLTDDEPE